MVILKEIKRLESTIPWVEYRAARHEYKVRAGIKKEAHRRLKELEAEVEPIMNQITAKEQYTRQISKVVSERKTAVASAEREADIKVQEMEYVPSSLPSSRGAPKSTSCA